MAYPRKRFSELVRDVSAGSPKVNQRDYLGSGEYPIIDQGAAFSSGFTNDVNHLSPEQLPLIVFGDHTRRFKFVDKPFAVGADGVKLLRAEPDLYPRFLFHFFNSLELPNAGYSRHFKFLREVEIPLPPLPEQHRIASILDQADALRAKRRKALELIETSLSARFDRDFGNVSNIRMGTISELIQSASYGTSSKAGSEGAYPILRMGNVTVKGGLDLASLKYVNLAPSERERYLVSAGDVLFNRTNSPELVGKTAVFREAQPMAYAGYLVRLRVSEGHDPEYLSGFLNSRRGKSELRKRAKAAIGMANINAQEVQKIPIPIPSAALQANYAQAARAAEAAKQTHCAHLAKLDELFASLQHRAFRGEL